MSPAPLQPDQLVIHVERELEGRRYALASPRETPGVPLLYRAEAEGYELVTAAEEADLFADQLFREAPLVVPGGARVRVSLPGGESLELLHEATISHGEREYWVLSEAPLAPQILCVQRPDGVLEPVLDPAEVAAVQSRWDEVAAEARALSEADPELAASAGAEVSGAELLAEARARASELRLTLQLFPSARRGDAEHRELSRLAEELDAQIAALEAALGG